MARRHNSDSGSMSTAVSGQTPPAGPQWVSGLQPPEPHPLAYEKPLLASLDGFTLHAATRAGALHPGGREALLRYVLRPPIAQERLDLRSDGLVRITLKKAYADGRLLSGSPGTSGSVPSSSIPSRPRRRRCRSMRRTVLSSTAPTSLVCRWPSPCQLSSPPCSC